MIFPLSCFCRFLSAKNAERQTAIVQHYKKQAAAPIRGRSAYYRPALQILRQTMCPSGTLADKLTALREACVKPNVPERLNDARVMSNARVNRVFRDTFGDKRLEIYTSPRLRFSAGEDVEISLQPDLFACVDGRLMLWKFGLNKKPLSEPLSKAVLQMMASGAHARGLEIAIEDVRYLDTMSGVVRWETDRDFVLTGKLKAQALNLAAIWRHLT